MNPAKISTHTVIEWNAHVSWWLICAIWLFHFVTAKNDNLGLFAFVFSTQNNDKTTWKNKINKAQISVAKYFAPLFIIFLPHYLSSRNHHKLRYFGANRKDAILRPFIFSLFLAIMWNNNNKMKKRRKIVLLLFRGEKINYEKKQNCIFLTSTRNKEKKQNCVFSTSPGNNEVYRYFVVKRQWIVGLKDNKKWGKTFHGAN